MMMGESTGWKIMKPQEKEIKTAKEKEEIAFGTYSFGVPPKNIEPNIDQIQVPSAQRTVSFGKDKNAFTIPSSITPRQAQKTIIKQKQGTWKNRQTEFIKAKLLQSSEKINKMIEFAKAQKKQAQKRYGKLEFGSIQIQMSMDLRQHYKQCLKISKESKHEYNSKQQFQRRSQQLHLSIKKIIEDFRILNKSKDKDKEKNDGIIQTKNQSKILKNINNNKVKIAFMRQSICNIIDIIDGEEL